MKNCHLSIIDQARGVLLRFVDNAERQIVRLKGSGLPAGATCPGCGRLAEGGEPMCPRCYNFWFWDDYQAAREILRNEEPP